MDAESEIIDAIIDAASARYPVLDPPGWFRGTPPVFEMVEFDGTPVRVFERCFGRQAWWAVLLVQEEFACDDGIVRGPARVRLLGATPAGGWVFDAVDAREVAASLGMAATALENTACPPRTATLGPDPRGRHR